MEKPYDIAYDKDMEEMVLLADQAMRDQSFLSAEQKKRYPLFAKHITMLSNERKAMERKRRRIGKMTPKIRRKTHRIVWMSKTWIKYLNEGGKIPDIYDYNKYVIELQKYMAKNN